MQHASSPKIDPKEFRAALGTFATGVTVITARAADGTSVGLTASSFNSVSIDPPMVLWSLAKNANSLAVFSTAEHWAVHVLAADQEHLSNRFSRAGADKFAGLDLQDNPHGVPWLEGCAARFQCKTSFQYEGGDHIIFVGEVVSFDRCEQAPLVFHGGRYALATHKDSVPASDNSPQGFCEDLLGYLLGRSYFQFHQRLRDSLRDQGLTDAEWYVAALLMTKDGPATAAAIDTELRQSLDCAVAPLLQRLIVLGWAEVHGETDDGSAVFRLTDSGRSRALHLLAEAKAIEVDFFGHMNQAEGAALKSLLRKFMKSGATASL